VKHPPGPDRLLVRGAVEDTQTYEASEELSLDSRDESCEEEPNVAYEYQD
jgi:hypothetical protein